MRTDHVGQWHRVSLLSVVMASLVAAAAGDRCVRPACAADKPNIVLCMADDQGWGDVSYNGHPVLKTPVLDEMARTGLRLDRFYSAAPVCSPTRGSVLTGRHPNRFGCFSWGHTLRPQEVTIAEALRQAGYTTGHFGKWHLGSMRAGAPDCPGQSGFDQWFSSPNFYENSPLFSHNGKVIETKGESSMVTMDLALGFMRDAARRDKPFLAVVWFGNPHTPHVALPEVRKPYADQPAKLANYYGEMAGIDLAMGKLRRELRKMNLADNTLVWYTSDNGSRSPGSTGGLRGQKGSLWEGGIRVPCVIEWPARIKSPRRSDLPGNTFDIYPTLVDLVGVKVAKQVKPLDGVSLAPLINGKMESRGKGMGFWVYPQRGHPMRSRQILEAQVKEQASGDSDSKPPAAATITDKYDEDNLPGHAAWMDGNFKLHRIPAKAGKVQLQLYDLAGDAKEQTDLASMQPDRVKAMAAALDAWQKSVIRSLNGKDYTGAGK